MAETSKYLARMPAWVLIAAAFAPMTTREILYDMRNALVLALVTALSVVALPFVARVAERFLNRTDIESRTDLTIAIIDDPVMAAMAKRLFPKARQIVVLPDYDALPHHPEVDATLSSLAHARAWTALRTTYTAILPKNLASTILFAFLMPDNSGHFRNFVDYWLRVQRTTGFRDRMIKHWIDGNPDTHAKPRWSVLRALEGR